MQLIKKFGFYTFVIAALLAAVWAYLRLKENNEPKASVASHIPSSVSCIIETKNINELINQLTRQNLIWNNLLGNKGLDNTQLYIHYFDSILKTNEDIESIIKDNSIFVSFFYDKQTLHTLIQFKVKEKSNETLFIDFFKAHFKLDGNQKNYETFVNLKKWYFSISDGIVYICTNNDMIEKASHLLENQSIAKNQDYLSLQKLNGIQNTQIYFNDKLLNLLPTSLTQIQSLYTLDVKLDEITFTGYLNTDSTHKFLKDQQAIEFDLHEKLPQHPTSIIGISATNPLKLYECFTGIKDKGFLWKAINDSALYDMQKDFFDNINFQVVLGNYEVENKNIGILAFNIKDFNHANQLINIIKDSTYKEPELEYYHIHKKYKELFSIIDELKSYNYVCVHDHELIFMSDFKAVSLYKYAITNSLLLSKDLNFIDYAHNNFQQSCQLFCYENLSVKSHDRSPFLYHPNSIIKSNNSISHTSYTLKNYKNKIQIRLNVSHEKQKADDSNSSSLLWSYSSDSTIISPINQFTNHITQENELCFQDNSKQLYLISSTGNLIWKKKIDENIKSSIYTVDIFKNGKFQLLFNTDHYLHLIDRNGNYVQGYPLRLPAKATSNISLLDYDKNKDYRIFIACADKHIYNFSLYGIKTEGFKPLKTDAIVELPIFYTKIGQSDYLITVDVMGKIYAFSRKGDGRIDFKNKTIAGLSKLFVLNGNTLDNSKLIYVDDKNNLLDKISLTDKKETLKLGDELLGFKTNFDLVNEDLQPDLLVFGDGAIYGYDLFSSKLVEHFSKVSLFEQVESITTSSHNYLLAFDKINQKLNIITKDGKLVSTIPNVSKQPFVYNLYKNGKMYLVIVYQNKVQCQLLE